MKLIRLSLFFSCLALIPACSRPGAATQVVPDDVAYYTCTMHPSVRSQDPDGKCPICGMDLVPVMKTGGAAQGGTVEAEAAAGMPHEFTIPLNRQQLIGVTYAEVKTQPHWRSIRAVGVVATTTANHWDYVARVDGYVQNLYVSAPGDPVAKGQVLMDLYSPDLASTENEYVDLLRMRDNGRRDQNASTVETAERLLSGARARLQQWNISDAQVDRMEKARKAEPVVQLESPFSGVVETVAVHQGRHISVGDHLVDIVDLSNVWVWAEFYENELPFLKKGLAVTITSTAMPGLSIPGTIAAVDPFLNDLKRTARVRIDVSNADFKLRPDAYVDVILALDGGNGLAIPVDAVLPTGEHNVVFVDRGSGKLEPRYVQLGGRFGDVYQVTAGLRAGEWIVKSANFLVDAESQVTGALKSW